MYGPAKVRVLSYSLTNTTLSLPMFRLVIVQPSLATVYISLPIGSHYSFLPLQTLHSPHQCSLLEQYLALQPRLHQCFRQ